MIFDTVDDGNLDEGALSSWMTFDPDVADGRTKLTMLPTLSASSRIKIHGNSTATAAKFSLALEIQDEYEHDRDLALFGMPEDSDWILQAPYEYDRALIRNSLMYQLSNSCGRYAPQTRPVEVYLNTNGGALSKADYRGVYMVTERIKRSRDRIDVETLNPGDTAAPAISGGYLFKIDSANPGDTGIYAARQTLYFVDPKEALLSAGQKSWLAAYLDQWWEALNGGQFHLPSTGYAAFCDPDSFVDHHLLNVVAKNIDAFRLSAYFSKDRLKRIVAGPIWDFDRSLDSSDLRDNNFNTWRGETGDRELYLQDRPRRRR